MNPIDFINRNRVDRYQVHRTLSSVGKSTSLNKFKWWTSSDDIQFIVYQVQCRNSLTFQRTGPHHLSNYNKQMLVENWRRRVAFTRRECNKYVFYILSTIFCISCTHLREFNEATTFSYIVRLKYFLLTLNLPRVVTQTLIFKKCTIYLWTRILKCPCIERRRAHV